MSLYNRMEDERAGQEAKINALAERRGEEIAVGQIRGYQDQQNNQMMNDRNRMAEAQSNRIAGQQEGMQAGLGMNPQTVQAMQQQQQPNPEEAAMQIISEVETAQQQGASQQQIQQMIASIPPELRETVQAINAQRNGQQQQQVPQQGQVESGSPINAYANGLLK